MPAVLCYSLTACYGLTACKLQRMRAGEDYPSLGRVVLFRPERVAKDLGGGNIDHVWTLTQVYQREFQGPVTRWARCAAKPSTLSGRFQTLPEHLESFQTLPLSGLVRETVETC